MYSSLNGVSTYSSVYEVYIIYCTLIGVYNSVYIKYPSVRLYVRLTKWALYHIFV